MENQVAVVLSKLALDNAPRETASAAQSLFNRCQLKRIHSGSDRALAAVCVECALERFGLNPWMHQLSTRRPTQPLLRDASAGQPRARVLRRRNALPPSPETGQGRVRRLEPEKRSQAKPLLAQGPHCPFWPQRRRTPRFHPQRHLPTFRESRSLRIEARD
ncbi:hypothetical protein BC830DRAFT_1139569 [Chytriomyces sp. MP71]|nr:hypothetical protein BC830DRAFT_1139569 [Chytriomyces sp. MP71]